MAVLTASPMETPSEYLSVALMADLTEHLMAVAKGYLSVGHLDYRLVVPKADQTAVHSADCWADYSVDNWADPLEPPMAYYSVHRLVDSKDAPKVASSAALMASSSADPRVG